MPFFVYSWRFTSIFLFSLLLLMGCGAAEPVQPTATTSSQSVAQTDSYPAQIVAYPAPEFIDSSGVIAAESESSVETPEPAEGLAALGGKFVNQRTGRAPAESIVYLGEIVYTDTGLPIIRLDRQTAPFAILADNGEFIFQDVLPAEYAVVFFTPEHSFPIDDAGTGETLILKLQPNDKIDLGVVELPIR